MRTQRISANLWSRQICSVLYQLNAIDSHFQWESVTVNKILSPIEYVQICDQRKLAFNLGLLYTSLAHVHLTLVQACASHIRQRIHISFWPAHAHHVLVSVRISTCACKSHFNLRMRISFWPAHAHIILVFQWECVTVNKILSPMEYVQIRDQRKLAFNLGFLYTSLAHVHLTLVQACASHIRQRIHISFWPAHAHHVLVSVRISTCACKSHFNLRMRISF